MSIFELDLSNISLKIREGSPAIFPTDTLPALGICPKHAYKLWEIKKRSLNKPLILMGASQKQLFELIEEFPLENALRIARIYWPGALTMVLPASGEVVDLLNPGSKTIGMRVPNSLYARKLLEQTGPLATTSANISGESSCNSALEASQVFPYIPVLGPLPWPSSSGMASTVIEWRESESWRFLRKGAVIPNEIE